MVITKIEAWEVSVPLRHEWTSSPEFGLHGHTADSRLILALHDDSGRIGWGEDAMPPRDMLQAALKNILDGKLDAGPLSQIDLAEPGESYWSRPAPPSPYASNPANLRHRLRHPLQNVVEIACIDLRARRLGIPYSDLLGGRWRDSIQVDYWMGRVTPEHARVCIQRAQKIGFNGVKFKTTLEDPNVERLEAIAETAGLDFHVTVDPNGRFYRLDDAMPVIRRMDAVGNMRILEDPFPRFHLLEFVELRRRIQARVAVHIDPVESLWSVLQIGAAGALNIDSKVVGQFQWRVLAGTAEQANLSIWHGSGLDLGIATAAQLHLAASAPNCWLPGDQIGPWLREHHLLTANFVIKDGSIVLPQGPGLGISIDQAALDRFSTWQTALTP